MWFRQMCARASTLWLSAFGENILTIEEKKNNKQTKKKSKKTKRTNELNKWTNVHLSLTAHVYQNKF